MNAKQNQFECSARSLETLADIVDDANQTLIESASHMREAAQGHARYEALRMLTPQSFTELWNRCIRGERFDDMVDELVKAKNGS